MELRILEIMGTPCERIKPYHIPKEKMNYIPEGRKHTGHPKL
jgi:hypothetical protein